MDGKTRERIAAVASAVSWAFLFFGVARVHLVFGIIFGVALLGAWYLTPVIRDRLAKDTD